MPETKAVTELGNPSTNNGSKQKKQRHRNRIRNKKNMTSVEIVKENQIGTVVAVEPQNNVTVSKNSKEPNNSSSELVHANSNEIKTEDLLVKDIVNQTLISLNPTGGQTGVKSREQIIADREAKKNQKQAKKLKGPKLETLGIANPATVNITTDKDISVFDQKIPDAKVCSGKSQIQVVVNEEVEIITKQEKIASTATVLEPTVLPSIKKSSVISEASSTIFAEKNIAPANSIDKTRDQIKAEREAKKLLKQAAKMSKQNPVPTVVTGLTQQIQNLNIVESISDTNPPTAIFTEEKKKPILTKAERRAVQEAQRAAKAQSIQKKVITTKKVESMKKSSTSKTIEKSSKPTMKDFIEWSDNTHDCKVKLFNHLESARKDVNLFVNNSQIHPKVARLGEQYAKRTVVGSNARCIAFLNALKVVIQDFETPPKKEFSRSLESFIKNCVDYLHKCRPLSVSVRNAYKHIKHVLTQLSTDKAESDIKENLCHFIDTYLENQIGKAALAINCSMQEKISNGDVILTFGCSSLINYIFEEAHRRHIDFRVIVVDSRPFCEGQELLRRLCAKEIRCTYVLINAVSFVMPEVTKILLGAHALLSNGYVMARTGTAQVALVAQSFNVPVLVCCETHKFSERFQTDAIVYNELGNPDDLILSDKCCLANWHSKLKMSPLNLNYDITPPELVTAVVTEVSILPCTSVPVILRIKPTEIGYYN